MYRRIKKFLTDYKKAIRDLAVGAHVATLERHERLLECIYKDIPENSREDVQFYDRMFKLWGYLRSSAGFDEQAKLNANLYFQYREKAEVALTVCSSWYGGDYFEFGAHDLNTFRNMLSAYDICGLQKTYPDVRFYAFDIFGSMKTDKPGTKKEIDEFKDYFAPFVQSGDQYERHLQYINEHNLFKEQCVLVRGFFQDTLSDEFKEKYKGENREIGFVFLDCNITPSYKIVFEFIYDLMTPHSYIYMDEYFSNQEAMQYFDEFTRRLREDREIGCVYVRNAGGFGALFLLSKIRPDLPPLELEGP